MQNFKEFLAIISKVVPYLKALVDVGATSFLVGGSTRDLLMGRSIFDLDIEVHGIEFAELQKILSSFGQVCCTGKVFVVLKTPKVNADWAIPRQDGIGRHPQVTPNKNLDVKTAAMRRDLTINAIYLNLNHLVENWSQITEQCEQGVSPYQLLEFEDHFGGMQDLKNKVLRAVDANFFIEDPLRFFRVMQFAARFEMQPDATLTQICKTMPVEQKNTANPYYVSVERINQELQKMLLKSRQPSLGLRWVATTGRMAEFFPELAAGIGLKKTFLPEGKDLFGHFCGALDAASAWPMQETHPLGFKDEQEKLMLQFSALLHDSGQATTDDFALLKTHEKFSTDLAQRFLTRFKFAQQITTQVCKLILQHEQPEKMLEAGFAEFKLLAHALAPETNLRQLALLALFDKQGVPFEFNPEYWLSNFEKFVAAAMAAGVLDRPEEPVVTGADLAGFMPPGPAMGKFLREVYLLQITEGIADKKMLLEKMSKKIV